jgi:hypothetical protein
MLCVEGSTPSPGSGIAQHYTDNVEVSSHHCYKKVIRTKYGATGRQRRHSGTRSLIDAAWYALCDRSGRHPALLHKDLKMPE